MLGEKLLRKTIEALLQSLQTYRYIAVVDIPIDNSVENNSLKASDAIRARALLLNSPFGRHFTRVLYLHCKRRAQQDVNNGKELKTLVADCMTTIYCINKNRREFMRNLIRVLWHTD